VIAPLVVLAVASSAARPTMIGAFWHILRTVADFTDR